jgi:hypothetical protein
VRGEGEMEEEEEEMMNFLCEEDRVVVHLWRQRIDFQVGTRTVSQILSP